MIDVTMYQIFSQALIFLLQVSSCHTPQIKQNQDDLPGVIQNVDSVNGSSCRPNADDVLLSESMHRADMTATTSSADATETDGSMCIKYLDSNDESRNGGSDASSSGSPWFQLRKDATVFVSQTLHRGRKNLWQLTTSRVSVLLSSSAVCSTSIHQFLRNYEDLNIFILAGEAFCGSEAVEFRQKVKAVCENYFTSFHRQNIYVSPYSFVCILFWKSKSFICGRQFVLLVLFNKYAFCSTSISSVSGSSFLEDNISMRPTFSRELFCVCISCIPVYYCL